mgnify:CR=1 FL=1
MGDWGLWDLAGKYPKILSDEKVGEAATQLYEDALAMLEKIRTENWIEARAVFGFWPANQINDDDIAVYSDESRSNEIAKLHHIRQQTDKPNGKPNLSLADFVAPKATGLKDYIGGFAVTTGINVEKIAKTFEANQDDYSSIMLKALADRLAESFAEHLHQRVRQEFWGYTSNEQLSNEDLIKERYSGIRPAPGYPACPDHTLKPILFDLLDATHHTGITLTESQAMLPTASVSGFYFGHPQSEYFGVARIGDDQVEEYAQRRGMEVDTMRQWLRPNLNE